MLSSIKARIEFSFQGEIYKPDIILHLDTLLDAGQDLSRLHEMIAEANNIDTYSYLFEVMESSPVIFSEAEGLAKSFLKESGEFDLHGFQQQRMSRQSDHLLADIAREHMQVDTLDEIDGLAAALKAAYDAGVSNS